MFGHLKLKPFHVWFLASMLVTAGGLFGLFTLMEWNKGGPPPSEPAILRCYVYVGISLAGFINLLGTFAWWVLFEVPVRRALKAAASGFPGLALIGLQPPFRE